MMHWIKKHSFTRLFSRGNILVLLAAMLWGTTGTSQALAPVEASPFTIGALRLIIGGAVLLAFAFARSSFQPPAGLEKPIAPIENEGGVMWTAKLKRLGWPIRITIIAAICVALYQVFFFNGVARAGVAIGTIVGIGSAPIFGGALGFFMEREKPGWRWLAATSLAIAGASLLLFTRRNALSTGEFPGAVVVEQAQARQVDPFGLLLAVGAGFVYATYVALSKGLLRRHKPDAITAVIFSAGGALLLPFLAIKLISGEENLHWLVQPNGLAVVLHLGVMATAVSYTLFVRGLQLTSISTATTLTLAEPLTAGMLGIMLLREPLTAGALAGIALVLAGIIILSVGRPGPKESLASLNENPPESSSH